MTGSRPPGEPRAGGAPRLATGAAHPGPHRRCRLATRRRWGRALTVMLAVLGLLMCSQPAAFAVPKDVSEVPEQVRQYIPDTPQWVGSPWMTAPDCADRGGSWSSYVDHVIADTPELLRTYQPGFAEGAGARNRAILDGYQRLAGQLRVPGGYCVDDVAAWASPDPGFRPFGFRWGDDTEHDTAYACDSTAVSAGSARAACDGFYVSCEGAASAAAHNRCEAWNAFSDRYVTAVNKMRTQANNAHPATAGGLGATQTQIKSPDEIANDVLDWAVKTGMAQVVAFFTDGVIKLWAAFLKIVVEHSSPDLGGSAFTSVYSLIAGVALALAFLGWLASLATSWREGRLAYTLIGGLKAALGVTLAGVGAILMLQLADDCTQALLDAGGNLADQTSWVDGLVKANPLVALIAAAVVAVFLLFAVVFLVVDAALILMWALFGAVAAAGQVHPASSGWLLRWASRLTALCWAKFFMVGVMLLCAGLLQPTPGAAATHPAQQLIDIIYGVVLAALLVATPYLLWELVDFVADRGGAAALGGSASQKASGATRKPLAKGAAAGGAAVGAMMSGAAHVATKLGGSTQPAPGKGGTGGGSGGGGTGTAAMTPPPDAGAGPTGGQQTTTAEHEGDNEPRRGYANPAAAAAATSTGGERSRPKSATQPLRRPEARTPPSSGGARKPASGGPPPGAAGQPAPPPDPPPPSPPRPPNPPDSPTS